MSAFKAKMPKMHKIRFPLGLRPRPRWGSLQRSPRTPWLYLRGLLLREERGRMGEEKERGGGEEGKRGKERREGICRTTVKTASYAHAIL